MIVVMEPRATAGQVEAVKARLLKEGFRVHVSEGVERTIIGAIGDKTRLAGQSLEAMPGVEKIVPILKPFKLAAREFKPEDTIISLGTAQFGGGVIEVIAGPCAIETEELAMEAAMAVKAAGAKLFRGGAFKPRTSPYSFQGLGKEGLTILKRVREETGLLIVTEVMDARDVELVGEYADILQVGARNMQNFFLLRELGQQRHPVLLKRGPSATIEEWILAAEYVMSEGNNNVILCERGIRTFENYTRNTLDLSAVALAKQLTHLPVVVDPSHATGNWRLVTPMALAAIAAGADGLLIEVHPSPETAWSDGPQSLTPKHFQDLMVKVRDVASAVGKRWRERVK
ncbi:MAG: 3-deoxy-7-phosphoheptulonate synthase [Clostridia bacterium]|nr:3-deoxy-7-phosphoheptulonate synthase [Clostridia bacterium]